MPLADAFDYYTPVSSSTQLPPAIAAIRFSAIFIVTPPDTLYFRFANRVPICFGFQEFQLVIRRLSFSPPPLDCIFSLLRRACFQGHLFSSFHAADDILLADATALPRYFLFQVFNIFAFSCAAALLFSPHIFRIEILLRVIIRVISG